MIPPLFLVPAEGQHSSGEQLWKPKHEEDVLLFQHICGGLDAIIESAISGFNKIAHAHGVTFYQDDGEM